MKKTMILISLIVISLILSAYIKEETIHLNTERSIVQIEANEWENKVLQYRQDYYNYLTENLEQVEYDEEFCLLGKCLKYNMDNIELSEHVSFYVNHQTNRFGFYYVYDGTFIPLYLYSLVYEEPYDDGIISWENVSFILDQSVYEPPYSVHLSQSELDEYKGVLIDRLANVSEQDNIYDVKDKILSPRVIVYD